MLKAPGSTAAQRRGGAARLTLVHRLRFEVLAVAFTWLVVVVSGAFAWKLCADQIEQPPFIDSFQPAAGAPGDTVKIFGANFGTATTVLFSGVKATFQIFSDKELVATVPADSFSGSISVLSPAGAGVSQAVFEVTPSQPGQPAIFDFQPAAGKVGTPIGISGVNLTGTFAVLFNGVKADFSVISDKEVKAVVPEGAATGVITVIAPGGITASGKPFEVIVEPPPPSPPVITGFKPDSGIAGDVVLLQGMNLSSTVAVQLGEAVAGFTIVNDGELKIVVPQAAKSGPFLITTPAGSALSSTSFVVTPPPTEPRIVSFSPGAGKSGDIVMIQLENVNEVRGVVFGAHGAKFDPATNQEFRAIVPPDARTGPIAVFTSAGALQSASEFVVTSSFGPPSILTFSPQSGPEGTPVSFTGDNLTGTDAVLFQGAAAAFSVGAEGALMAKVPAGAKTGTIRIVTQGGTTETSLPFEVLGIPVAPVIASFQPSHGPVGTVVEVLGSNFDSIRSVTLGGVLAPVTALTSASLRLTVPASAGSGMITVEAATGNASSETDFIVDHPAVQPAIDGFSAWNVAPRTTVQIRGTGLGNAEQVLINNLPAAFRVASDGELAVDIPDSATSGAVHIVTPAGTATSSASIIVSRPTDPPPLAPQFRPPAAGISQAGQIQFEFPIQPNQGYLIQRTTALGGPAAEDWQQIGAERPRPTGGAAVVVDSAENAAGFYRVIAGAQGFDNWDFEFGLFGWQATGDAFRDQPTHGEAYTRGALGAGELLRTIGGDYWETPVNIGHHAEAWVGTAQNRPDPEMAPPANPSALDANTGTLTSPNFRIDRPFITFLIGGNLRQALPPVESPRVELLVRPRDAAERQSFQLSYPETAGDFHVVQRSYVPGYRPELMRREVMSVAVWSGRQARMRIIDPTRVGHINVDDFRFPETDPRPGLISLPRSVTYFDPSRPPETQTDPLPEAATHIHLDPEAPVWGFADTHTHPAANLGFGGKMIHGFAGGSPASSLGSCEANHGVGGVNGCFPLIACAPSILMAQFAGAGGHRTGGYEYGFDGWPNVLEQGVHQQMYQEWIRRAWQGGLRLMVAHVVHNRLLADLNFNDGFPRDDMSVVERQIASIRRLVAQNSFMEIALTPRQAREIILRGKLAVVLGIEVDRPFLNDRDREISDSQIAFAVRRAYDVLGVRHMFPVHFADNPYGGFAMYNSLWVYNNWWVDHQRYPEVVSPATRGFTDLIDWRFEAEGGLQVGAFFLGVAAFPLPPSHYPEGGQINARGLQPAGRTLLREMMRRGMLIDVDHMGLVMKRDVFELTRAQRYPLISGHSGFTELSLRANETSEISKRAAESDLTPTIASELAAQGGMCAPITLAKDVRPYSTKVANDAPGSVKSWAQTYLRAVDYFGGRNVALATDFGLVHGTGPRFGMKAMFPLKDDEVRRGLRAGFIRAQRNGVRYAEPLRDYREHRFQGPNEGPVYDGEEKEFWEAIALFKSGLDPDAANRPRARSGKIKHLARGLFASTEAQLSIMLARPLPLIRGDSEHEIRAGYYVRNSASVALPATVDRRVRELYTKMLPIWQRWSAMEGDNRPMRRCTTASILDADVNKPYTKEWDINLDGLAHYGLLPDFLQDAKNSGLDSQDLRPLFRSAEDYIRLWERCEQNRVRD